MGVATGNPPMTPIRRRWSAVRRLTVGLALGLALSVVATAGPAAAGCAVSHSDVTAAEDADAIFVGEVVGRTEERTLFGPPSYLLLTFAVTAVYRGEVSARQTVLTETHSEGFFPTTGDEYLVFADRGALDDTATLVTNGCQGSRLLSDGPPDPALGAPDEPQPSTSTPGTGDATGWLTPVAGLALLGGLAWLLVRRRRTATVVLLLASAGLAAATVGNAPPAVASSCAAPITDATSARHADAIFVGVLVDGDDPVTLFGNRHHALLRFEVSWVYRGDVAAQETVAAPSALTSTGAEVGPGPQLVFASRDHFDADSQILFLNGCGGTRPIAEGPPADVLGAGAPPTPGTVHNDAAPGPSRWTLTVLAIAALYGGNAVRRLWRAHRWAT